jgi:hypothetical protein
MQRINNILNKGKYQSKLTDESEDEMPLKRPQLAGRREVSFRLSKSDHGESNDMPSKRSQLTGSRRGSFRLSKKDSSRSITSQDPTHQSSHSTFHSSISSTFHSSISSTFHSSISSVASVPCHYDELSSDNESLSWLQHVQELKPRLGRAVEAEKIQTRKPKSTPITEERAPRLRAPLKSALKANPHRSRTVEAEKQDQPQRSRSKSDAEFVDVPRKSTARRRNSLDDCVDEYSKIMEDFPDERSRNNTDCYGETGW